jgi:mRNA interferase MazF
MEIKQYDIILIDLTIAGNEAHPGAEMLKTRPCVVISPDEMNRYLRTIVVAPMTTKPRLYPTRVRVRHDKKQGWIVVDQIRTIDRKRAIRRVGKITNPEIRKLKGVIRETYVD